MPKSIDIPAWVRDAVFYQIFPDRFAQSPRVTKPAGLEPWDAEPGLYGFKGGDLLGIAERLPYLRDLGVNALYLTPIFASTAYHRYHTYDYFAVDPILGGNAALRELLDEAHRRNVRVILDGVFNHTGRGFLQFQHTLENGRASPYLDWFHWNKEWLRSGAPAQAYAQDPVVHDGNKAGDSLALYGYKAWWDLPALPKLNTDNPEVRAFIYRVAEYWIDFGIDGWRLDVPFEIDDDEFWREFRRRVRARRPDAYIVGEVWGDSRRWLAGDQFDAVMNYLYTRPTLGFALSGCLNATEMQKSGLRDVNPTTAEAYGDALEKLLALYPSEVNDVQLNLLGSHDTPRLLTMASGRVDAAKLALTSMFTFVGAPCVYYGDEIGMRGGHDPGCRAGFPRSQDQWNQDLRSHVKKLAEARRRSTALRRGSFTVTYADQTLLAYQRAYANDAALVLLNNGPEGRRIAYRAPGISDGTRLEDALTGATYEVKDGVVGPVPLGARAAAILLRTATTMLLALFAAFATEPARAARVLPAAQPFCGEFRGAPPEDSESIAAPPGREFEPPRCQPLDTVLPMWHSRTDTREVHACATIRCQSS